VREVRGGRARADVLEVDGDQRAVVRAREDVALVEVVVQRDGRPRDRRFRESRGLCPRNPVNFAST
jgi:hypothetical protein